MNKYWNNYKTYVSSTSPLPSKLNTTLFLFGLTSEIGTLFSQISEEIIYKKSLSAERIETLGDIFWYLAAFEIHLGLPNSLYTNYIGSTIQQPEDEEEDEEEDEDEGAKIVDVLDLHRDIIGYLGDLGEYIILKDKDDIQFTINKIILSIFNLCIYYNIAPEKCLILDENKSKTEEITKVETNIIKTKDKKIHDVILDIQIDNRRKSPYKSISMEAFNTIKFFNVGDIITDFFTATNFLSHKYKKKTYNVIYSAELRKYLEITAKDIYSGFLIDDKVISIKDLVKNSKYKGGKITISYKAIPILMKDNLNTLERLLDHINDSRKQK